MKRLAPIIVLVLLLGSACASVGPRTIRASHYDYNEAIVRTRNEQLLLNLVRMRYRDTPFFLEVSGVATQYNFSRSLGAAASFDGEGGASGGVQGGLSFTESPTVTYAPLSGEDFAKRLLSPVPLESLLLLTGSGWRIDRVWRCCVQRINELWNAPGAAGPTPDEAPEYEAFREAAALARRLQAAHALEAALRPAGTERSLMLRFRPDAGTDADAMRLKALLGVPGERNELSVSVDPTGRAADEVAFVPRSLIGVLYFLSQAVEPPLSDVDAGRVTLTRQQDGSPFDWSRVTGDLLRVRSSPTPPADAFVRVPYRGAWFYIDDADLTSKSTFGLLDQLFSLQAGRAAGGGPLLTLPVGQ